MTSKIIRHFFIKLVVVILAMNIFGFLTMPKDCGQCIILIPIGTMYFSLPILFINALQFLILFKQTYNNNYTTVNFTLTILPSLVLWGLNLYISDLNSSDSKILLVGVIANLLLNIASFFYINKYVKTLTIPT